MNNPKLPDLVTYDGTISYADGSESDLLSIVSDPSFNEFTSWRNKSDWAQYYHLSPLRRNIMNWVSYGEKPLRILELGAGCGAITSFLVTIPSSQVVAVEGALDRAKVIQARCKDASNLQIHACALNEFKTDEPFDIITLIGVLEYAGRYETGEDPFLGVLSRAENWLSENGVLVVAIENQLGCKYISGCREDHYGTPFEGINGYPHYTGVKTFTHNELSKKLTNAGLAEQKWFYPYPDYKLPSVIFSDKAFSTPSFDWIALTDVPPEPNENPLPAFSDRAFLSLVQQNSNVGHFMNSFLVFAGKKPTALLQKHNDIIAVKSNVKFRARPYQTSTIFSGDEDGISVLKKRIFETLPIQHKEIKLNIEQSPEPYYRETINLFDAILKFVENRKYGQALQCIKLWTELLQENALSYDEVRAKYFREFTLNCFGKPVYEQVYGGKWISGSFVDLIPLNILVPLNKSLNIENCRIIDREWGLTFDIPIQLVFDRGFKLLTSKIQRILQPRKIKLNSVTSLPGELHNLMAMIPLFSTIQTESHDLFESWFQLGILTDSSQSFNMSSILSLNKTENPPVSIEKFMSEVVLLVESNDNRAAIEFYDKYRKLFHDNDLLIRFDSSIESLRGRLS